MKTRICKGSLDFYSGLLLSCIAAIAVWFILDLRIGTPRSMGPGFFPLAIAIVLGAMGLFLLLRGLVVRGADAEDLHLRPLAFVLLSMGAFAVLIDRAGLIVAVLAQIAIAIFASRETKLRESVIFGAVLATFCALVFVRLLGVPVRVLPW
ncbi:hypothetical protein GCM10007276_01830 [Agaricicola taiwanensis]|uniref:DUF1468 domain-containing protein n=1 Tax=Agaricicola taiwanensis TaxID=591372 RepID=A0A8J2YF87_9RHOB|nr:tripartite tricarboxylate transporter TctB family protein [Agaricicola taiwanensis]GGE28271.1 hypothetical protein GCM10007276_01830 [Agaricicola taiwanensis]